MSKLEDDNYWRERLTPEEFYVCREKGTERAFTGEYWDCFRDGTYRCRCCGEPLFVSESKFDAGCGWPSFYEAAGPVAEHADHSHGMVRTEITCGKCRAHLGHVFPDGPAPTGLRYCVNSLSISLDEEGEGNEQENE
ncbi:peptide-methionine (R)-S-oxide reductase MsrB [Biformimicrobium ophioploci]|uniref:peptide-methionine (R)-S-oxide reductase n=1 Tax=Biformimicrobium ophioploci TaxID=3036711 RepID=A0ABQ6LY33_9GAMM|nr:peptide-methionine (R)-S-oxide reductase MsrB [Microbulbifer sp. NKW57]GMG87011.1 peptide-methionine (R)-S-oxide reductase MsrB [Microbulbifer sp. NKW57]